MKFKFLFATLLICFASYAQNIKTIKGSITDQGSNNEPLAYATILIKGTDIGASSDENGKFILEAPEGIHTLEISYIGYVTKEVLINTAKDQIITISLEAEDSNLEDIIITVKTNKGSESALLNQQRVSLEMKQNIGSQELSRKGVGDVATAVTKTSGISKQESTGGIFVRGLGDRYNSTTMNGLPIPSNKPDTKNIDLNLFSTDIVEYISIDKTYLARNYGDFAGGNVDIISKKNNSNGFFNIDLGANINTNAISKKDFALQGGRNYFGFSNNNQSANPLDGFNFKHNYKLKSIAPYAGNLGLSGGKNFFIGSEGILNAFATLSFSNDYGFKEGINKSVNSQGIATNDLYQKTSSYNTNTTGMLNLNYDINTNNNISYNFLMVNSSSLKNDNLRGFMRDIAESKLGGILNRNTYEQNQLFVNQLLGKHILTEKTTFNWGAAYNHIKNEMPDRTQNILMYNENIGGYGLVGKTASDNHRYFQSLKENEFAFNASLDYSFDKTNDDSYNGKLTLGYNGRFKKRNFEATQFILRLNNQYKENYLVDVNNLDSFFNQQNYEAGYFDIETFRGNKNNPNALEPQYYNGKQSINAAFVNVEYQLNPKLFAVLGLRYENINQEIDWKTQLDFTGGKNTLEKNAFLPSLSLKYELNSDQNLRLAFSKTYTLPQFKERAPFIYEEIDEVESGNPDLYASDDYNFDLKWELFPQNDEVLSATAFGKYIQNPINKITISSSANDLTFVNSGKFGYVYGIEIEARKNLYYFNDNDNNKLSAGVNVALMKTHQELDNEKIKKETNYSAQFTNSSSGFTGASNLLLNADVTYFKEWNDRNIIATLAYNYNSDRLYSIGTEQKGNLVDKGFGSLDLIFKTKLNKHFTLGLSAKNLTNPAIKRVQENKNEDILVRSYKLGQFVSASLKYTF